MAPSGGSRRQSDRRVVAVLIRLACTLAGLVVSPGLLLLAASVIRLDAHAVLGWFLYVLNVTTVTLQIVIHRVLLPKARRRHRLGREDS